MFKVGWLVVYGRVNASTEEAKLLLLFQCVIEGESIIILCILKVLLFSVKSNLLSAKGRESVHWGCSVLAIIWVFWMERNRRIWKPHKCRSAVAVGERISYWSALLGGCVFPANAHLSKGSAGSQNTVRPGIRGGLHQKSSFLHGLNVCLISSSIHVYLSPSTKHSSHHLCDVSFKAF